MTRNDREETSPKFRCSRVPPSRPPRSRDEETGDLWGPTALPIREDAAHYVARHGRGYSRFEHTAHGIFLSLLQFVPVDDPVKISRLTIENRSDRSRRLSVTAYVEWVLGVSRSVTAPFIVTEIDPDTGALLAWNPWNADFDDHVAFADLGGRQTAWTGDRTEVLGRNGTLDPPALQERGSLPSGRVGAGLDPCAVLQTVIEVPPGGREGMAFALAKGPITRELVLAGITLRHCRILYETVRDEQSCRRRSAPQRLCDLQLAVRCDQS